MSDKKLRILNNIKELRVLNDPYRQGILSQMDLIGRPATSKEIAMEMNEAPSKVNYHLKVLEEYNFVKLDHTKNVNGIIAKYYVSTTDNFDMRMEKGDTAKEREISNIIATMFNNARDKYINGFLELAKEEDEKKHEEKGMLSSTKLYMNDEEVAELKTFFHKLTNNKKEGRELYDFFLTFKKDK